MIGMYRTMHGLPSKTHLRIQMSVERSHRNVLSHMAVRIVLALFHTAHALGSCFLKIQSNQVYNIR